jgi:hypothetical protein
LERCLVFLCGTFDELVRLIWLPPDWVELGMVGPLLKAKVFIDFITVVEVALSIIIL